MKCSGEKLFPLHGLEWKENFLCNRINIMPGVSLHNFTENQPCNISVNPLTSFNSEPLGITLSVLKSNATKNKRKRKPQQGSMLEVWCPFHFLYRLNHMHERQMRTNQAEDDEKTAVFFHPGLIWWKICVSSCVKYGKSNVKFTTYLPLIHDQGSGTCTDILGGRYSSIIIYIKWSYM